MSQIECKNMSIGYVNKTILRNLNFEINQGSIKIKWRNGRDSNPRPPA